MPYYNCPNCDATIMPAEWIAGICPRCRGPVATGGADRRDEVAGAAPKAWGASAWDSSSRPIWTREGLLAWCGVRTGCTMLVVGGLVLLVSGLVLALVLFAASKQPGRDPSSLAAVLGGLLLLGAVIYAIGQLMVVGAPSDSGAAGWVLPSLVGFIGGLLCLVAVLATGPSEPDHARRFFLLTLAGFGLGHHCLGGALGCIATHLGAAALGRVWTAFLCLSGPCHAVILVALFVLTENQMPRMARGEPMSPAVAETLQWAVLALLGLFLAWFVLQTFLVRTLLSEQLLRAREEDDAE